MSKNFSVPFSLTPQGTISVTSDPNVIANNRVECLIGTSPGERVMLPDYGVDLQSYLFGTDIIGSTDIMANNISDALSQWEPSLNVTEIVPVVTQSDFGISEVNVEFTLSTDPNVTPVQTATVLVGGSVVNK